MNGQTEERKRLRQLINADKKERLIQRQEEYIKHHDTNSKSSTNSSNFNEKCCVLAIKLFDGSTIKHEFNQEDTLIKVREWLDNEIEVIPSNKSMPSFATRSYPYPTGYLFHRPILPRMTYNEEQESKNLLHLQLTPRAILILKPTYDDEDSLSPKPDTSSSGYFKRVYNVICNLSSALISFFDYGVDTNYNNNNTTTSEEPINLTQPIIQSPGFVSLSDRSVSSSLLNIQHPEEVEQQQQQQHNSPKIYHNENFSQDSSLHLSNFTSRSPTPRPLSSSRVQTLHDDERIDTYNGNSINLNERDEND
ncbi:unnamed protein product [Candida verbasci]|uniref:UBX domain-containing protein n=1 Tax=Candida verbasci TaxID=1227364 RepID=A0A9W4TXG2_9ASCO|nr:unnamed protein product [Candida verbasci]